MLDKNNKILYSEMVSFTNNLSENSKIRDSFFVILPNLLLDIVDLYNYSHIEEWKRKSWHIDKLVLGFGSNYLFNNLKLISKKIFYLKKKTKFYNPLIKKFGNVKKLFIDFHDINTYLDLYEEDLNNSYISSVSYIFYGEIRNFKDKDKIDKIVDLFIDKIFSLDFLIDIEDRNFRLYLFKEKLKRSIIASIKRFKQCEKFLPKYNSDLYLGSLYNPFNRLVAIEGKRRGFKVISDDHGPGVAFSKCPICQNVELDLVSEFITFSETYKKILLKSLNPKLRFNKNIQPIIKTKKHKVNYKFKKFTQFTDILYVPSCITKIAHIPALLDPNLYLQLQLNILSSINSVKNFNLFIREHPETQVNIPQLILNDLKVKKVNIRFEDLKQKFIFIIDHMQCTCLRYAIENNIPVIAIVTNKDGINENIFNELCASPNFKYMIPEKRGTSFLIDKELFVSLIEEIEDNYSYNYENNIF